MTHSNTDELLGKELKVYPDELQGWVPIEEVYGCITDGWFLFRNGKKELGSVRDDKMYPYNQQGYTFVNGDPIMFCDLLEPYNPRKELWPKTPEQIAEERKQNEFYDALHKLLKKHGMLK